MVRRLIQRRMEAAPVRRMWLCEVAENYHISIPWNTYRPWDTAVRHEYVRHCYDYAETGIAVLIVVRHRMRRRLRPKAFVEARLAKIRWIRSCLGWGVPSFICWNAQTSSALPHCMAVAYYTYPRYTFVLYCLLVALDIRSEGINQHFV